jgi:hypothetical protein
VERATDPLLPATLGRASKPYPTLDFLYRLRSMPECGHDLALGLCEIVQLEPDIQP